MVSMWLYVVCGGKQVWEFVWNMCAVCGERFLCHVCGLCVVCVCGICGECGICMVKLGHVKYVCICVVDLSYLCVEIVVHVV